LIVEATTTPGSRHWLPPLTGVLFLALVIAAGIIAGEVPDASEDSAEEVRAFYVDNDDEQFIGSFLFGFGGIALLFFAGWLRAHLRLAEGPSGILSAIGFAGAIVLAVGIAVQATLTIAIADVADDIEDPLVFQTLNALSWSFWVPFAVGTMTFFLANGLSVLRHGALARWLGWVAIAIMILAFTPLFFVAFPAAGLWILFVSVTSALRLRREAAVAGPAPPAGPPPAV
jgi:hypothetical protein